MSDSQEEITRGDTDVSPFFSPQSRMHLHQKLILASRSPRRVHLLRQIGLNPRVIPCEIPEEFDPAMPPAANAEMLALRKARCVAPRVDAGIIIGADTIVLIDGMMLGKPLDSADAVRMLRLLSGRTHTVLTGFALVETPSGRSITGVEETRVTFRILPEDEIRKYVAGGSPLDKAGAYGIQDDYGAVFVTGIEGCFYNVVGLPLSRLYSTLEVFQDQRTTI